VNLALKECEQLEQEDIDITVKEEKQENGVYDGLQGKRQDYEAMSVMARSQVSSCSRTSSHRSGMSLGASSSVLFNRKRKQRQPE